ncbi:hypothetical protein N657DRAFT_644591 [Parathielavia appendiculata]|uniref:Uncharacterized protein n=1 Tax=Parathielavia appendiculata TaxID=2587402 RepID=A0AAN6U103_9PEZI|nr:hypothetical protein N657DRAFT_644591 [Parathielavia appendiculata]
MQFKVLATLAALAATCSADQMKVFTVCKEIFGCDSASGRFYTAYGNYYVNANEGLQGHRCSGHDGILR